MIKVIRLTVSVKGCTLFLLVRDCVIMVLRNDCYEGHSKRRNLSLCNFKFNYILVLLLIAGLNISEYSPIAQHLATSCRCVFNHVSFPEVYCILAALEVLTEIK